MKWEKGVKEVQKKLVLKGFERSSDDEGVGDSL